jgi:phosphoribosyl 1,2-cyclic phosphodiesterase
MPLRTCILGSGSSGNCTFVGSATTGILIDAGLSAREVERRLEHIDVAPSAILGICVSHEHQDHTTGIRVLHQRHGIPVFANAGAIEALQRDEKMQGIAWKMFMTGQSFAIGDLVIEPFSVPHDAYDPVGFTVSNGEARIGIVTDMGVPTSLIRERLRSCQAVVVEANHDEQLLRDAERPWHLKQRISGRQGHLSNQGAAKMLADIAGPNLSQVFLAHLSKDCNRQDLAYKTTSDTLIASGYAHVKVSLTFQDRVSEVWSYQPAPHPAHM